LSSIYDGIQRRLVDIADSYGDFVVRGVSTEAIRRDRLWTFQPMVDEGDEVAQGDVVGEVQETAHITHRIMVPPGMSGRVAQVKEGDFNVDEVVVTLDSGGEIKLHQTWPARVPRPVLKKENPTVPFITGTRILQDGDRDHPGQVGGRRHRYLHRMW
jgi:V/A-type H+-transporting ATPase subunit A